MTAAIIMLGFVIMVATIVVGMYCILRMQDENYQELKRVKAELEAAREKISEQRVEITRLKNRKVHDADNPE